MEFASMCRMIGFLSLETVSFAGPLLAGATCLSRQAAGDRTGMTHSDGWGIGVFPELGASPCIEKAPLSAAEDRNFPHHAHLARGIAGIAHVRKASVGSNRPENCHPFSAGRILFAHNGTIAQFENVRPRIFDELGEGPGDRPLGSTDSEAIFCWLLQQWSREGFRPEKGLCDPRAMARTVMDSMVRLVEWTRDADPPSALNFLLTDGFCLLATCYHRTLWYREVQESGLWVAWIASEPFDDAIWNPIPSGTLLLVERGGPIEIEPIEELRRLVDSPS